MLFTKSNSLDSRLRFEGRKAPECYVLPSQSENLPERPPGSLFGDNPSGWAFGRMGQIHMGRANPFGALVAGLAVDEFLLLRGLRNLEP